MTPNSLLKKARSVIAPDIAGTFVNIDLNMESLEPVEREAFYILAVSLLKENIDKAISKYETIIKQNWQIGT